MVMNESATRRRLSVRTEIENMIYAALSDALQQCSWLQDLLVLQSESRADREPVSITILPKSSYSGIVRCQCRTEPEAFFLEVFFNALPVHNPADGKQKPKASNALVPSLLAYTGDEMEFVVEMGAEWATRLMIFKGAFESVSIAIYGDVSTEIPPPPIAYEPMQTQLPEPIPLTRSVDPSNSAEPTWLANELLALIPDSPSLMLIIRLMLCLKPSNDDWDLPDFPHLYADLEADEDEFDLEQAFWNMRKPVSDDVPVQVLEAFAEKVAGAQKVDLERVFSSGVMDEATLLRLLDASTNPVIGRHLSAPWFIGMLDDLQANSALDRDTKQSAKKLATRIQQWHILEDTLSNTQGDFKAAAALLKDISTSESSLGIWLQCMITHPEILAKLAENPVLPNVQSRVVALFEPDDSDISHDQFVAFLRAFIGVACVLVVYAWSDSLPNDRCRERTLAVIRLWQGVDGYQEIVNHMMLLRQMTYRLDCMTSVNESPTLSGAHAESILMGIAHQPASAHSQDLAKCVLNLPQPLTVIDEDERLALRQAALISDVGVAAAVEELTADIGSPRTPKKLRVLRVALAVVEQELDQDELREWHVLQALWGERTHGLVPCLADILLRISQDLGTHFTLTPPPPFTPELIGLLFATSNDLLRLLDKLITAYPLTARLTRSFTITIADVFIYTDAADMQYAQSSPQSIAANKTRQTCVRVMRGLTSPHVRTESGKPGSQIVLRTLLEHGVNVNHGDPAYHLIQVFYLVDHLLQTDGRQLHWISTVIPSLLSEIRSFFFVLDLESRFHFFKLLINLDNGIIGIAEWILIEEAKQLLDVLRSLQDTMANDPHYNVARFQVTIALRFIWDLLNEESSTTTWFSESIKTIPRLAQTLAQCFLFLVDGHIETAYATRIAVCLSKDIVHDHDLKFSIALILLHSLQHSTVSFTSFQTSFIPSLRLLKEVRPEHIDTDRVEREMRATFSAISESEAALAGFDKESAEAILSALDWLPERDLMKVTDVGTDPFVKLCTSMMSILSPGPTNNLDSVRSRLIAVDQDGARVSVELPEHVELSLQSIENLLQPIVPTPSTPKRKSPASEVFGLVTLSPPIALLRSPTTTGLTKTYMNNDFRQLRQQPSARQNTSRLPSMHVDVGIVI
ncbi:hypothetical protein HWV62_32295 [Athelia sp. TMB]|nr:hypothetical protein HWV62_32295 [Athelia sp. TMB]